MGVHWDLLHPSKLLKCTSCIFLKNNDTKIIDPYCCIAKVATAGDTLSLLFPQT